jgi:hypothetical protein
MPECAVKAIRPTFIHVNYFALSINVSNNTYHLLVLNVLYEIGIITSNKAVSVTHLKASVKNVCAVGANIEHDIILSHAVLDRGDHNVGLTLKKKRLH